MDFSLQYDFDEVCFLVKKPKRLPQLLAFIWPLDLPTWLLFLLSVIVILLAFILHNLAVVKMLGRGRLDVGRHFMYVNSLWTMESHQDSVRFPRALPISWRIISCSATLGFFILSKGYSGGLFSFLSVPAFQPPMDALKDIAEVKIMSQKDTTTRYINLRVESLLRASLARSTS